MAWSFRVARLFGIDVRVHIVFVALIAWFSIYAVVQTGSFTNGAIFLFQLLVLFGFVLLHELGHSVVAQKMGIRVIDITLWPLGGLARLEGYTENPKSELRIALAGPAVNLVFALALFPFRNMAAGTDSMLPALIEWVFRINLCLGLFNLVPAFPMDGGRILRALVARWLPYLKATEIAVFIGRIVAVGAIIWDLSQGDFLGIITIIALFILWAGNTELRAVRARESLGAFERWYRSTQDIIDGKVVSSGDGPAGDSGKQHPLPGPEGSVNLKPYEREFIEKIRQYRKGKGES